jgi:hypothetical protein
MISLVIIKNYKKYRLGPNLGFFSFRTIGWGTIKYPDGTPVRQGDTCTQAQADYYLEYEVKSYTQYWSENLGAPQTTKMSMGEGFCRII